MNRKIKTSEKSIEIINLSIKEIMKNVNETKGREKTAQNGMSDFDIVNSMRRQASSSGITIPSSLAMKSDHEITCEVEAQLYNFTDSIAEKVHGAMHAIIDFVEHRWSELQALECPPEEFSLEGISSETFLESFFKAMRDIRECEKTAENTFKELAHIDEHMLKTIAAIGFQLFQTEKFQESLNIFFFLNIIDPENAHYLLLEGHCCYFLQNYEKAAEFYSAYLELYGVDFVMLPLFVYSLIAMGACEKAHELKKQLDIITKGNNNKIVSEISNMIEKIL